ncbi:hypothetical protein [Streptomyces sp. NPDC059165]|uniref:hypothetical protein n=1 Tax=Streptomyces sp. NPDC059165 TaxID=3346751 RepID=UPI0036C4B9F0
MNPTEFESAKLTIRCDTEVSGAGTGCVFSRYKPTYVMNSKKFPGAAAHIDMMWRKTNVDWGNRNGGKPLTFLDNSCPPTAPARRSSTATVRSSAAESGRSTWAPACSVTCGPWTRRSRVPT